MTKFKFHWGWAILLVYITFMTVFLFFFYKSFDELKTNDLVTEDYYEKELVYGEVLEKKQHADTMRVQVQILSSDKGVEVVFPDYISRGDLQGKIVLYKPDNKTLDQEINLVLDSNNKVLINKDKMIPGRWDVILDWEINKVPYFKEQKIIRK
jgi:hypothetical protein